jgi:hypothetical protein
LAVLLALAICPPEGSTYRGIRAVLGIRTDSGVRQAVRAAKEAGLVRVLHTPSGPGALAVVRLTYAARKTLTRLGLPPRKDARP